MEKLETVKELVRANNYTDNDLTFKQCQKLGVTVNRVGLELFARKLRVIDNASINNPQNALPATHSDAETGSTLQFEKSSIQLADSNDMNANHASVPSASNVTHLNNAGARNASVSSDPVERKREITLELGTIKVREYELLQELNSLVTNNKAAEAY